MFITTKITVGFKMPEEYAAERDFVKHNGTNKWIKQEDTNFVYYTLTEHSSTITTADSEGK